MKKFTLHRIFFALIISQSVFLLTFAQTAETTQEQAEKIPTLTQQKSDGFTIIPAYPNTINPRKFIFELKPGEKTEDYVSIKNLSDQNAHFLLYGADSTLSNQGTLAYKTRQNGGEGEGKWVSFQPSGIDLGPQETKLVKFTIETPKDTNFGDYKFGIAMEKSRPDANNPNITIATRVILHGEVKITNEPKTVPKLSAPAVTKPQISGWQSYYFWISLGLFMISLTILAWTIFRQKKNTGNGRKRHKKHTG